MNHRRQRRCALAIPAVLLASLATTIPVRAQTASPGDDGCMGAIEHWQSFAAEENQGGHMDLSVYNRIQNEIDRATALCQSGQDAQALKAIEGSKRRHGY